MTSKKRELTIEPSKQGTGFSVYEWGVYEQSSVLAGQTRKSFIDGADTERELMDKYPDAVAIGYSRSANNTFGHLPGEDDPVPGGSYPDDYDDYEDW